MTDPRPILRRARAILAAPSRWTQKGLARTVNDTPCSPESPYAYSYCLVGAIQRASNTPGLGGFPNAFMHLDDTIGRIHGGHTIGRWNDREDTTHADVLAILDEAIQTEPR